MHRAAERALCLAEAAGKSLQLNRAFHFFVLPPSCISRASLGSSWAAGRRAKARGQSVFVMLKCSLPTVCGLLTRPGQLETGPQMLAGLVGSRAPEGETCSSHTPLQGPGVNLSSQLGSRITRTRPLDRTLSFKHGPQLQSIKWQDAFAYR
jgi:hypothetical protein